MIRINAKHFCDYYKILNVPRNAAEKEIKLSYIKLAKLHHPDKGGASEVFKKIVDAYQTLKDPIKRQLYNKKIKVKHTVVKEQPEDKRVDPEVSKFESELSKIDMDKLFFEFTAKKNKSKANQIMVNNCLTCLLLRGLLHQWKENLVRGS